MNCCKSQLKLNWVINETTKKNTRTKWTTKRHYSCVTNLRFTWLPSKFAWYFVHRSSAFNFENVLCIVIKDQCIARSIAPIHLICYICIHPFINVLAHSFYVYYLCFAQRNRNSAFALYCTIIYFVFAVVEKNRFFLLIISSCQTFLVTCVCVGVHLSGCFHTEYFIEHFFSFTIHFCSFQLYLENQVSQ